MNKELPFVQAFPIISYSSQRTLLLHQDAFNLLSEINSQLPCSVTSIIGKSKTGKSYFLNRFIQEQPTCQQYFKVFNGVTNGTSCVNVFVITHADQVQIILDTKGLGSLNSGNYQQQRKLISTILLLSSTVIYNSIGPIDEQTLQNLGVMVEISRILQKSISHLTNNKFGLPAFLMLLRDFSLLFQDQKGNEITPKQYLQKALQNQKGNSQIITNKNRIRKAIRDIFSQRSCTWLPVPSEQIIITNSSKLRQQFTDRFKSVKQEISCKKTLKILNGRSVTIKQWINLARQIVDCINKSKSDELSIEGVFFMSYRRQIQQIKNIFISKALNIKQYIQKIQVNQQDKDKLYNIITQCEQNIKQLKIIYNENCLKIYQLIMKQNQHKKTQKINFQDQRMKQIRQFSALYKMKEEVQKIIQEKRKNFSQKYNKLQEDNNNIKNIILSLQQINSTQCQIQLDHIYKKYLQTLKTLTHCPSIQFQNFILKLQVAYLRKKMQLKSKNNILHQQQNILKQKCQNTQKRQCNSDQIKKQSFLIPYVILSQEQIGVQVTKTMVKQDRKVTVSNIQIVIQTQQDHILLATSQFIDLLQDNEQIIIEGNQQDQFAFSIAQSSFKLRGIYLPTTMLVVKQNQNNEDSNTPIKQRRPTSYIHHETDCYLRLENYQIQYHKVYQELTKIQLGDNILNYDKNIQNLLQNQGVLFSQLKNQLKITNKQMEKLASIAPINFFKHTSHDYLVILLNLDSITAILRQILPVISKFQLYNRQFSYQQIKQHAPVVHLKIFQIIAKQFKIQSNPPLNNPTMGQQMEIQRKWKISLDTVILFILAQHALAKKQFIASQMDQLLIKMLELYLPLGIPQFSMQKAKARLSELIGRYFVTYMKGPVLQRTYINSLQIDANIKTKIQYMSSFKKKFSRSQIQGFFYPFQNQNEVNEIIFKNFRKMGNQFEIKLIMPK